MIGQKETKQLVMQSSKPCILVGKKGMGKLTMAKELYPFATFIGNGKDKIKIEEIRQVLENTVNTTYQVYVIRNADNLTVQSQNALLKVLEECPPHIRFLILCEDINKVLITIKSRCDIYRMQLYSNEEIVEYVKLNYPHIKKYELLQNYCKGVLGVIDRIAGKLFKDVRDTSLKIISNLDKTATGNIFNIINHIKPFEGEMDLLIDTMMNMYSDICFVKCGAEESVIDTLLIEVYKKINITADKARENVFILDEYKRLLGIPYNFTMFVDTLMLKLKGV